MIPVFPLAAGCAVVGLFVGTLAGYAWHRASSAAVDAEPRQPPSAAVLVEAVEPRPLNITLRSIGALRAVDHAEMRSLVAGVITAVDFSDGQDVTAGDVLVRINDSEVRQNLAAALAARNEAQRTFDRAQDLEQRGLGTSNQRERLAAELEAAVARVAAFEAQLDDYVLRAPFAGRIGLRQVSPGTTVAANDFITTVTRLDPLRVSTTIPERYANRVRPGIPIQASSAAHGGGAVQGTVVFVAPTIDAATRTLRIEAEIPNAEGLLRPGQTLDIQVTIEEREGVIAVPEEALVLRGATAQVWVVSDGRALPRPVTLGSVGNGRVEIRDGLSAGDAVVVRGIQKILFPGIAAEAQPWQPLETAE